MLKSVILNSKIVLSPYRDLRNVLNFTPALANIRHCSYLFTKLPISSALRLFSFNYSSFSSTTKETFLNKPKQTNNTEKRFVENSEVNLNATYNRDSDKTWLMNLNIRSLRNKIDKLQAKIDSLLFTIDILCISEHWLKSCEMYVLDKLKHFKLISCFNRDRASGGTCILVTQRLAAKNQFEIFTLAAENSFECSAVQITDQRWAKPTIVTCIYRSPKSSKYDFVDRLDKLFTKVNSGSNKQIICCGDFNIDAKQNSKVKKKLISLFESYGLTLAVYTPTRCHRSSQTQIDYIAVNYGIDMLRDTINTDIGLSDHKAQFVTLPRSL